eukprot:6836823-Pyramimonas_sp.AAC.1
MGRPGSFPKERARRACRHAERPSPWCRSSLGSLRHPAAAWATQVSGPCDRARHGHMAPCPCRALPCTELSRARNLTLYNRPLRPYYAVSSLCDITSK